MTIAIYAQLAVLALIDSTSIGTLLIPLWLLLRPDAKRLMPRILLYLGVLAGSICWWAWPCSVGPAG